MWWLMHSMPLAQAPALQQTSAATSHVVHLQNTESAVLLTHGKRAGSGHCS